MSFKYQVDSIYTITLLIGKLTTVIPDLVASFESNIYGFNRFTCYIGTAIHACGEETGNQFPQIFATYYGCSLDKWTIYTLY